jgi:hypothetical protein
MRIASAHDLPAPVADLLHELMLIQPGHDAALVLIAHLEVSADWKLVALLLAERCCRYQYNELELALLVGVPRHADSQS